MKRKRRAERKGGERKKEKEGGKSEGKVKPPPNKNSGYGLGVDILSFRLSADSWSQQTWRVSRARAIYESGWSRLFLYGIR